MRLVAVSMPAVIAFVRLVLYSLSIHLCVVAGIGRLVPCLATLVDDISRLVSFLLTVVKDTRRLVSFPPLP